MKIQLRYFASIREDLGLADEALDTPARDVTGLLRELRDRGGAYARALAEGRPVFVDFTAAWCVTCQYNKRTALANEAVLADFAARRVALLRADWTRRDRTRH